MEISSSNPCFNFHNSITSLSAVITEWQVFGSSDPHWITQMGWDIRRQHQWVKQYIITILIVHTESFESESPPNQPDLPLPVTQTRCNYTWDWIAYTTACPFDHASSLYQHNKHLPILVPQTLCQWPSITKQPQRHWRTNIYIKIYQHLSLELLCCIPGLLLMYVASLDAWEG